MGAIGVGPYRVVAANAVKNFETRKELIAFVVGSLGSELRGLTREGGPTRPELHNQPKFSKMCGPMWDGDAVRYETPEMYAELSI